MAAASPALVCPACRQSLQRRRRRWADRVLSPFVGLLTRQPAPLRRYACTASACGWEGLLSGHLPRRPGYLPDKWL